MFQWVYIHRKEFQSYIIKENVKGPKMQQGKTGKETTKYISKMKYILCI